MRSFWLMAAANHPSLREEMQRLLLKCSEKNVASPTNHASIVCSKHQKNNNFVFTRRAKCGTQTSRDRQIYV